jgi:hypothetical protein
MSGMEQLCGTWYCLQERAEGRRVYPVEQGSELCSLCRARVRDDIAELPKLYEEFESSLIRFPYAFEERVSGGEVKGLGLNEASVNARSDIISVLATWAGMVTEERRLTRTIGRDVASLAAFLTRHLDWLLAHPTAPYFADEVATMAATARRASRPRSDLRLPLGYCVEEDCDASLYAAGTAADARSQAQVRCEAGHMWQAHEWLMLASRISGQGSLPPPQMNNEAAQRAGA